MATVQVQLEEQDYVDAARTASAPTRRSLFALAVVVVLVLVALVIGWRAGYKRESFVGVGVLVGTLGGGWIGRGVSIASRARGLFRQQKTLRRPYQVTWDTAGVTFNGENGTSTIHWSDFHKTQELENQFLLFLSDANFLIVPKRVFPDSLMRDEFRDVVTQRVIAR
jgi:hypothetical protein